MIDYDPGAVSHDEAYALTSAARAKTAHSRLKGRTRETWATLEHADAKHAKVEALTEHSFLIGFYTNKEFKSPVATVRVWVSGGLSGSAALCSDNRVPEVSRL